MDRLRKSWPVRKINRFPPVDSVFKQGNGKRGRKSADCAEIGDAVWHTPFLSRIAYSFLLASRIRFTFCFFNFARNYTILVKVRPHETFGSERGKKRRGDWVERRRREKRLNGGRKRRERKVDKRGRKKETSNERRNERGNTLVEKRCKGR